MTQLGTNSVLHETTWH